MFNIFLILVLSLGVFLTVYDIRSFQKGNIVSLRPIYHRYRHDRQKHSLAFWVHWIVYGMAAIVFTVGPILYWIFVPG